ncbi:hypothetical protein JR316_0000948 [Psilocybe cubensis]|uniref:Uncharacterized protein n=2 Tax=Psilocybe cubensis TaxID=181762 RepID=A0A8H8CQQ9_PSICU|nr:hypothetical protein JR316_0000948 [Psilocybe cubensis]KAH9486883.1 hypothetical protein JR316_0000948 [Psilocybe cubensis]
MFLPRADGESDGCPSGHVYCAPPSGTAAIVGNQSGDSDSGSGNTTYANKPGMHRFIGIAMVIVLLVVAFVSWLCYIKRTRKESWGASARAMLCCCGPRRGGGNSSKTSGSDASNVRPVTPVVSEKDQRRSSVLLQSEPRGLVKEVSGGVVMFTEAPRAALLPGKDRYPVGWEFEHVDGVRFEVIPVTSPFSEESTAA